jgi:hypothetical protein
MSGVNALGEGVRETIIIGPNGAVPKVEVSGFASGGTGDPIPVSQPGLSGGILQSVTTVGASAVPLPATPLAGRAYLDIQAWEGNTLPIFLGTSTVTARVLGAATAATDGIYLLPGEATRMPLAAAVILYARATAATQKVTTFEVAA